MVQALREEVQGREGPEQAQKASERLLRLHVSARFMGFLRVFFFSCFDFVLIDWCDGFCREEFRKDYKEKHPNVKQVSVVSVVSSADSSFDSKFAWLGCEFIASDASGFVNRRLARLVVTSGSPCPML